MHIGRPSHRLRCAPRASERRERGVTGHARHGEVMFSLCYAVEVRVRELSGSPWQRTRHALQEGEERVGEGDARDRHANAAAVGAPPRGDSMGKGGSGRSVHPVHRGPRGRRGKWTRSTVDLDHVL
jgi:hypothetical protein